MFEKDFQKWHGLKTKLDSTSTQVLFKEREIWWCSVGVNVGEESDGKSKLFSRPILVLRRLTKYSFVGLPTTTADKQGTWYVQSKQAGRVSSVMLNQIRIFSSKRLSSKMGELDDADWKKVKERFLSFYQ